MNYGIDSDFHVGAKVCTMKYRSTGCYKHIVFDRTTDDVSMRPNEAIAAECQLMFVCAAEHCIFHDNAVLAQRYRFAFRDDAGPEQDAAARRDTHISADRCIGRCITARIDSRFASIM
jgi:hypothetical protein